MTSPDETDATESVLGSVAADANRSDSVASVLSTLLTGYAESQQQESNAERADTFATFFINHLQENN